MLTDNASSDPENQQGRWLKIQPNPQRLHAKYSKIEGIVDLEEMTLLGILYTDGCLSPKGKNSWRFYVSNTSWQVILAFKQCMINLFNLPEPRIRISIKQVNGKPFYKAVVDSKEIGQLVTDKYGTFRTLKYQSEINGSLYPPARLPECIDTNKDTISHFLRIAFSCDGGVNLYLSKGRYLGLIRNVYLACQHPALIKQYDYLLKKLGINGKILWEDELLRIQGRENLEKFAKEVGFLEGVKVTQNSAYWQGSEKQTVLNLAIKSYGNPQLVFKLPQFRVKI